MNPKMHHIDFISINSTQIFARTHFHDLATLLANYDMIAISSEMQTAGVGKAGSNWDSPNGNMYATYIFKLSEKLDNVEITQRASIGISRALGSYSVNVNIKWINDLLINNMKICGILCEVIPYQNSFYLLIGVGLNLITKPSLITSSSVLHETGITINRSEMIDTCASYLYSAFSQEENQILFEFQEKLAFIDQNVTCSTNNNVIIGILRGITSKGLLKIEADGKIYQIYDGKISLTG